MTVRSPALAVRDQPLKPALPAFVLLAVSLGAACVHAPRQDGRGTVPVPASSFDPSPWLEDLNALVLELSSHYANLDFAVQDRRMDLAALKRRTETRLRAARSDDQAKAAFRAFLRAFGDAHLALDWPVPAADEGSGGANGDLCARLGYAAHDPGGVDFTLAGGFTQLDDGDADEFPGGVLTLPGGQRLGVLRISLFLETAHPKLCEAARVALGLAGNTVCDDACRRRLDMAVSNRLTAALERRARSFARAGVAALAVDLTGNGGGSSWVDPAVRVLTPVRLRSSVIGVVRHGHWTRQLNERLQRLEADLAARGDLGNGVIASAITTLREEITEVRTPCDQSALWVDGAAKPTCRQLVRVVPVLPYAPPGSLANRAAAGALFGPSQYEYEEGANRLPLVVLVDAGTASAAEDFAETLQDQHAAVIVGAQTVGAGCGFTNGGIPTVLPRSKASVRIPDCARLRSDGSNAVAGVLPDIVLPLLDRDSPYQRAAKMRAGLQSAWGVIAAGPPGSDR